MRDIGLVRGVRALWQENLLYDYTIKVQGQQIKAHKVVLASVSEYFKAMLSEGFIESKADEVELKGLNAEAVAKLIEFIYTGDESIIGIGAVRILNCAVFLQMPSVAEVCVEKLLEGLDYKNCLELYSVLKEYSFSEQVGNVRDFIQVNWQTVYEACEQDEVSHHGVQVLIDNWGKSEWDMFMFINDWYNRYTELHEDYLTELMSQVRFCLIDTDRLKSITEMRIYSDAEAKWHDLVEQALQYHQLPTHLKVLEQSDLSQVRTRPSPVFFNVEDTSTYFALDEKQKWKKYENVVQDAPMFERCGQPKCIEVNNYFIMWMGPGDWHIFDPRTLKWYKIAEMEIPRFYFVLLHHGEYLYLVGGNAIRDPDEDLAPTFEMDRYSFKENDWSSVAVPYSFMDHAACIFKDEIYVQGGNTQDVNKKKSRRSLYSLGLSCADSQWQEKAPFKLDDQLTLHEMFVVCIEGEDVILVTSDQLCMWYYSPAMDQWTTFDFEFERKFSGTSLTYCIHGSHLCWKNSLFVLNVELFVNDYPDFDESEHVKRERYILNWVIPKKGKKMKNHPKEKFPFGPLARGEPDVHVGVAVLAIPH